MKIRKLDPDDLRHSLAGGPISIGRDIETEHAPPEPLWAPLERYAKGEAFLDGTRTRWVRMSSLGADGSRYNKAMRGL